MISRFYITCAVCNTHHTLRVQMGYGNEQRHRFKCHHCSEPISFNLLTDNIKVVGATLTEAEVGAEQKTNFQYLSPDFVADSEDSKDPAYFGSMELMTRLLSTKRAKEALTNLPRGQLPRTGWFALSNALPDWEKLLVCWRLERNGKYFFAFENLQSFDKDAGTSSFLAAVRLGHRLFGANNQLMMEARKVLEQNTSEASKLLTEYSYRWAPDFREAQFQIFSEFFDRWDAFSQVYLYIQNDISLPKAPVATSVDFEHVRGFYSAAQEFLSKQVGILTALNNINAGRNFDKLNNISLSKYFSTDNAKRCDNFKHNASFFAAVSEYDSSLRNAEAHGGRKTRPDSQELFYLQGGNGPKFELGYVDYLYKSVLMFRQICQLMQLESLLRKKALQISYQLLKLPASS